MGRFILSVGSALMLMAGPAAVQAQGAKTVTGTITSIAANSITVKAADGKEMTYTIDSKTRVEAKGASTKSREAQAEGKGVAATELLKTGQAVEIHSADGTHASTIRAVSTVPTGAKTHSATGVVSAIGADSVTIKSASGETSFSVDDKTTVSGEGVGTAGRKMTSEGKKTTLGDFLHEGDTVAVTYHDMEGKKHASVIRITQRKK